MHNLVIETYGYGSDNYGFLIHDPETKMTACVDAGDDSAALSVLSKNNWALSQIWITHHHADHTNGVAALKAKTGATVYAPQLSAKRIDSADFFVRDADTFIFANHTIKTIATPGHTLDMINYYIADQSTLFTGDTLFTLGCGRLFEGDGMMMWDSLCKIKNLPEDTLIYGAHEYTLANLEFALSVDPDNEALKKRALQVYDLRSQGLATVPTILRHELQTNPFLRANKHDMKTRLDMANSGDADVFGALRRMKDDF